MKKRLFKLRKGFSLVELVIVILIIVVLAVAVFAGGSSAIRKSRISRAESDLHNYDVALTSYVFEQTTMVGSDNSSDFISIAEGMNDYLPVGMLITPDSPLPMTGSICNSNSELSAFQTEKEDPWGNPYFILLDCEARNDGHTEYFITVASAGPNGTADAGGKLDEDDMFLLLQYQNGVSSSKTYNMGIDTEDATGTALIVGESGLSIVGSIGPAPRNLGETMDNDGDTDSGDAPGGSGGGAAGGGTGGSTGGSAAAHTHSYVATSATAATCTAAGSKILTCSKCGATKTETGIALGHLYGEYVVTTEATCTTEGAKTSSCSRSGCTETRTQSIPMTGHNMSEATLTQEATRTTEGIMTKKCLNSGCTYTETTTTPKIALTRLAVTTKPTKTTYNEEESFDSAGMVVTAYFEDGSSDASITYTVMDGDSLQYGQNKITVSYEENGVSETATTPVSINGVPTALLYSDGQMVFQTTTVPDAAKVASGLTYTSYKTTEYPWLTKTYSAASQTPWYTNMQNIVSVTMADDISPASTAFWFYKATNLKKATLSDSLTSIGRGMFYQCTALNNSVTIPETVTAIGKDAFSGCIRLSGNLDIPSGVTSIGSSAFYQCSSLTGSLVLPAGITKIEAYSFEDCKGLTGSITIPDGVSSIGDGAFRGCSGFSGNLVIPSSVKTIGINAFAQCSKLTGNCTFSSGLESIATSAFQETPLSGSLVLPETLTSLGSGAFYSTNLSGEVVIPEATTSITDNPFSASRGITAIKVDTNNPNYCALNGVLYNKSVTETVSCPSGMTGSVTVPDTVTKIGNGSFYWCSRVDEIILPDSVISIGTNAFLGAMTATGVMNIPQYVQSIGNGAFSSMDGLTAIQVDEYNTTYCSVDGVLYDKGKTTLICWPQEKPVTESSVLDGTVVIADFALNGCTFVDVLTVPETVTSIKTSAFQDTVGLNKVITAASIGDAAFRRCKDLESIEILDGSKTISWSAFSGCSNLTSITIPDTVTYIGNGAFLNCSNLTNVYYTGTEEEWNAINIYNPNGWNDCLINANITYNYAG